ncbi:MAG: flippase-like domain-containing protein, partial [Candidatus Thermoplasmatota archaeon]|nr:flippase-like domain-containing protein [Candidatus Thermoplasmatota archaeon]
FATVASDLTMEFIVDGVIVMSALILLLVFMSPPPWIFGIILVFTLISSLIVFVILDIYYDLNIVNRVVLWACKHISRVKEHKEDILEKYEGFRQNFKRALQDKGIFSQALTLSFMRKSFTGMKYYVLLAALGYQIGFVSIFIAIGLSITLLLIPGIPGNIGVYEGGMAAVFIFLGVPSGVAAMAVFLDRLVWYWGITGVGGILGTKYGMDLIPGREAE